MSGQALEDMAVVAQVSDIVQAFKEASSYLKRIKERRRSKPPPRGLIVDNQALQDLEFCLSTGQDTIRKRYELDYRRLKQPFATGDREASEQLKAVLVDLQKDLVADLKFAYQHDQQLDFLPLQDVAADCQGRAVVCLMQLHQRITANINMTDTSGNNSYPRRQPSSGRTTQATPTFSQSRPLLPDFNSTIAMPPSRGSVGQLLTPEQSPLYETTNYMSTSPSNQNNLFRKSRPIEMPSFNGQPSSASTLPTPPLEKAIGPPPSAPLPPLPSQARERKRREPRSRRESPSGGDLPQKETQTASSFLDQTFVEVEAAWDAEEVYRHQETTRKPFDFQEPHPGTPVDPSRIDEPTPTLPRPIPKPMKLSIFPSSPMPMIRTGSSVSPQHLAPPPLVASRHDMQSSTDRPSTASGPVGVVDYRLSTHSNGTISSQSGVSVMSSPSGHSSFTSGGFSWTPGQPMGDGQDGSGYLLPSGSLPSRTKSLPRVPDPIYEIPTPTEPHSAPGFAAQRMLPVREASISPTSNYALGPFPPDPRTRTMDLAPPLDRRPTAASIRSMNSSTPSQTSGPMPVRTIAPQNPDSTNSKDHLPSEANKFGGLCKSAWRAQIGDMKKAYSAERKPAGNFSMVDYMGCKNCTFSGRVAPSTKGKKTPDRRIIVSRDTGVAYRWDFLFKSHLPVKGSITSKDAEYGCMFCCSEGRGTPVFKGMEDFIAHVAQHRPGVAGSNDLHIPDGPVVDRMDALIGRAMEQDDRWEIALPQASGEGAYAQVPSTAARDAASVRSGVTYRAH